MSWDILLAGFGLMLVFEGILPFLAPTQFKNRLRSVLEVPDQTLRWLALFAMLCGVLVLNLAH